MSDNLIKILADIDKISSQTKIRFEHLSEGIKELKEISREQIQILREIEDILRECMVILNKNNGSNKISVALIWVVIGQIASVILTLYQIIKDLH